MTPPRFWRLASLFIAACFGSLKAIPSSQRQALLDLYASTNGTGWKASYQTGWSTNATDPCTSPAWSGLTCLGGSLTQIYLKSANLVGPLPYTIGNLTSLQSLTLTINSISGPIPSTIGNLMNLQTLLLGSNMLSGTIPGSMASLTNLSTINLSYNRLSGSVPSFLGDLRNLLVLDLSSNQLTGTVPSSLGNLSNLQQLVLSTNGLSGTIPVTFGNLTKATALSIGYNSLTGSIPTQIGNLVLLTLLYLPFNQLSGSIPNNLGGLNQLQSLILSGNQLTGPIPSNLGNLQTLTQLELHFNQLNGTIPPSLGNLTNLIYLYLLDNQLTGPIPSSLWNLTNLQLVQLAVNQLTGTIPATLANWNNVLAIQLYSNLFTGSIPDVFGKFTNMMNLGLQNNLFTGPVPSSLSSVTSLRYLNLMNNQLSGQVNSTMCSLPLLTDCFLTSNNGLWFNSPCAKCPTTAQRLTVTGAAMLLGQGLNTVLNSTGISVNDSMSSNPILYDFSNVSSSIGQLFSGTQAVSSTNSSAIAAGLVSFQVQTPWTNTITVYITPTTVDGATLGPYPFNMTLVTPTAPTAVSSNVVQFWNVGSPISIKSFLNYSHPIGVANQILYNISYIPSSISFQYRGGNSTTSTFYQSDLNQDLITVSALFNVIGMVQLPMTISIGTNSFAATLTIITAPASAGFNYSSSNNIMGTPAISSIVAIQTNAVQSIFLIQGTSFNTGKQISYVQLDDVLCTLLNVSFTSLAVSCAVVLQPQAYRITVYTASLGSILNATSVFTYTAVGQTAPLAPAASDAATSWTPFIFAFASSAAGLGILSLLGYWIWRRRRRNLLKTQSEFMLMGPQLKQSTQSFYNMPQSHTVTDINNTHTIYSENEGFELPGYLLMHWDAAIRLKSKIGSGGACELYLAELLSHGRRDPRLLQDNNVAIKVISTQTDLATFHQEVAIMAKLSYCPYCVQLFGYTEDSERLSIIMKLYPYTLSSLIHDREGFNVPRLTWLKLYTDIINGLLAIHALDVAHLDIKPSNVLVDVGAKAFNAVITDFGISKVFTKSTVKGWVNSGIKGVSIHYTNPSTLKAIRLGVMSNIEISKADAFGRDIYALAVSGWEIICREYPWEQLSTEEIISKVVDYDERPKWVESAGDEILSKWKDLIEQMWQTNSTVSLQMLLEELDQELQ